MLKKLLADKTAFIIPSEMVMFLAVVLCVTAIGWAITRETMDIEVMPDAEVIISQPQADMAVNNAGSGFNNGDERDSKNIQFVDHAKRRQTNSKEEDLLENVNICGRE